MTPLRPHPEADRRQAARRDQRRQQPFAEQQKHQSRPRTGHGETGQKPGYEASELGRVGGDEGARQQQQHHQQPDAEDEIDHSPPPSLRASSNAGPPADLP